MASFLYSVVTFEKALENPVFGTTFSTNAYGLIERFMFLRGFGGSKRDTLTGDRIYRIHENDIRRLDLDRLGRRFIPTRIGNFYFSSSLPTQTFLDDSWLPVGI